MNQFPESKMIFIICLFWHPVIAIINCSLNLNNLCLLSDVKLRQNYHDMEARYFFRLHIFASIQFHQNLGKAVITQYS